MAPVKGPCLVLVIEWQPRWTNMCLSAIHMWLVHRYMCVSNSCHDGEDGLDLLQGSHMWWRSSLPMRHDIESCDQGVEDQDKTWLDGPVASVKGKLEALERWTVWRWSLSKTWCWWTKATVKSKWGQDWWTNKITWCYEVDHIICWSCRCMYCINTGGDGIKCARQMYNL